MNKKLLLICFCTFMTMHIFSQSLFTYGANEVSKDEFIRAFNKNSNHTEKKEQSLKDYLQLYTIFKLKVAAAKDLKLDTTPQLKYDMMNFRTRLENDYMIDSKNLLVKTSYKKNSTINDDMLYLYADSAAYSKSNNKCPMANDVIFTLEGNPVIVAEWLLFAKNYKLNSNLYKGESNSELMEKFTSRTASNYYRKHLAEYNSDFKYQLQEFKEGNLLYEIMGKKVWDKSAADFTALQQFYEANKNLFLWNESAEVILVNARSYAYADYAMENMKKGQNWKTITAQSEGMIQGDSSRYEIAQLPIKPDTKLTEGSILEIVRNDADNSASFVKIIKVYPPKLQRTFQEAKNLVVSEYQKHLEENWMRELTAKYPVKINNIVFQSLLK